ncbi:uncharacterized protein Z520_04242 [Fonsecaea multimorphosa CBS 102226]|uniref:Inner centromere protein ARK-binding domain-containing protein n=1 Tax=Fonsecaea multimorphosa CBS 102226 TaxID=1442371 RepID=A0A0D2K8T4_9EURO|nr:uncharacterized protein Z520_04242 [Fonsecaea multimorphosa CBS 102226]KIX99609.1 hypothetical protein Z520_04242 [Fonsecaea multimorphosa CBS 102226]OAL26849.1 hypothetical protein AYO22_04016 [Fonsecaea multimorphosa]
MTTKGTTVGSVSWIAAEKENALSLLQNEKEEVIYPAQHQLEWLNEHMSEIFNKSHLDVANVFKTPGKLRGKTPRTARKRHAQDARIPLSDVFSTKPLPRQSPQKRADQPKLRFEISIATDQTQQPLKSQTDSGYHTASQEDVDIGPQPYPSDGPERVLEESRDNTDTTSEHNMDEAMEEGHRTTEGSFHSAKEDQTTKIGPEVAVKGTAPQSVVLDIHQSDNIEATNERQAEVHPELDDIGSPSDESTPERPLVRKSSLTFAALPAREPLKSSIGTRISRTSHIDQIHRPPSSAYGFRPNVPSSQAIQHSPHDDNKDVEMDDADDDENDSNVQILGHDDSESENQVTKAHSKFSTQRLHEKIDMLGKVPPPRPSKSIPSAVVLSDMKQLNEQHQKPQNEKQPQVANDDDDDWIKPLTSPEAASSSPLKTAMPTESDSEEEFDLRAPELIAHDERMRTPVRMSPGPGKMMPGFGHTKSASTATLASPAKASMAPPPSPAKSISVSNPTQSITTPQGSPRRYLDLSASKSKLQSIMKTAKGLFTSSASVSAAAKLETLSPNALKVASNAMPGMYPNLNAMIEDKPLPASPAKETRKTRSSTEREREEKRKEKEVHLKQRMDEQLEKAREEERKKVAEQKLAREQMAKIEAEQLRPSSPKQQPVEQQDSIESAARPSRPIRLGKDHPMNKAKPAPVSIRVGTLSQRMPASTSQVAANTQETLAAEPKRPGLNKKTSTASLQSSTSTTVKSSVHPPQKPRALLAAERKKEQDEREAQRKLEQKRELERKRAAQQEEARRQEQRQRAEAEKRERERVAAEQAKRQAQQQAIERKRQETARKAEQQRLERAANEAAQIRPSSRLGGQTTGRPLLNHPLPTNPAKPAKRPLEEEQGTVRPQNSKYGFPTSQGDTKRRKTEEETVTETLPRPVVSGAPIRQSQLGKKASIFNHSTYTQAQSSTYVGQFPQPPSRAAPPQMQQYATGGKIPFADAPNPPAHTKTPVSIMQQKTIQTVKSSPQYPNGDAIHLPEIPTDSEDEESDDDGNAFPIPDWATPGHLTEQLMRQEGMDGDAVFGPIAPLKIEEIFSKGNKDRLKRLRDRTSSANWALSGDGLTLEEVKADREQRERMRLEGGWRYGN